MSLTGDKIILITGANSGIGYQCAKTIVSRTPYHVIVAGRSLEKCDAAVSEIKASGSLKGTLSSILVDVTDRSSVSSAAKQVEQQFGRIDVLMNNAGVLGSKSSVSQQVEDSFMTNVVAPQIMVEQFKDLLLKSEDPYILYTSSALGSLSVAGDSSHYWYNVEDSGYRATKAALNMLALQNSKFLSKEGVKVFPVCPGYVVSNLRGTSEEERSGGGYAQSPESSADLFLSIIEGKRDSDVGKFVYSEGVYAW